MAQYFFKTPFAESGDVAAIPRDLQPDGSVSYEEGFTVNYQEDPDTEPTAKDVPRDQFNQLMLAITEAIQILQINGFPDFITTADNGGTPYEYAINATVRFAGGWAGAGAFNYYSLVDANDTTPADQTKWGLVSYQQFELPGVSKKTYSSTLPTGYVWENGTTIGSAASGATGRANADTISLYTVLWNSVPNSVLPIQDSAGVATSRGISAAADFAANKRLPVPDSRGRAPVGNDNMGAIGAANRITTAGCGIDGSVLGAFGGAQNVALVAANNGPHSHSASSASAGTHFHTGTTNSDGTHTHQIEGANGAANPTSYVDLYTQGAGSGGAGGWGATTVQAGYYFGSTSTSFPLRAKATGSAHSHALTTNSDGAHTHTVTVDSSGSGTAHLNVQPSLVCNWILALGTA